MDGHCLALWQEWYKASSTPHLYTSLQMYSPVLPDPQAF